MAEKIRNLTIETSSEDKMVLDMLSSKNMTIDSISVCEICSEWNSKVHDLNFDEDVIKVAFKPLVESEILVNYLKGLSTSINYLRESVQNITDILVENVNSHVEIENNININDNVFEEHDEKLKNKIVTINKGENPSKKIIKEITNQDSLGLSTLLYKELKIRNTKIDDLLNDDNTLEEIMKTFTSSHLISKELKKQIKKLDNEGLSENLKNMIRNKMITIVSGTSILNMYFEKIAFQKNKTKKELFEEVSNKELVYNKLYYINKSSEYIVKELKKSNFNEEIQSTYNSGNKKLNEEALDSFRMVIDILSEMKKTSVQNFLKISTANDYKEVVDSLSISSHYINSKTDSIQELLNILLGGE